MSTIQNFIKRHYIKITSATALAVGLYKFAEYAVVDHSKGQSYPLAFMQNVYWLLQERLGILEQDKIPYKEEDISRETKILRAYQNLLARLACQQNTDAHKKTPGSSLRR